MVNSVVLLQTCRQSVGYDTEEDGPCQKHNGCPTAEKTERCGTKLAQARRELHDLHEVDLAGPTGHQVCTELLRSPCFQFTLGKTDKVVTLVPHAGITTTDQFCSQRRAAW